MDLTCPSDYQKFVSLVGYAINFLPASVVSSIDIHIWRQIPMTIDEVCEDDGFLDSFLNSGESRVQVFCCFLDI